MQSSLNGYCQGVWGVFKRCHTKRRGQAPQTLAFTRLLLTASVEIAKRTSFHPSTLGSLVWDRHFARVRVAWCKQHWYPHGVPGTVHIKPSWGVDLQMQ